MAHFDTSLDLLDAFVKENFEQVIKIIDDKIERDWNNRLTIPTAKELVKKKYESYETN
jgi:hypothetical protein